MRYYSWRHLFEYVIRHCVADEAADIEFVQVGGFGDIGIGCSFIDGEGFCCSVVRPVSISQCGGIACQCDNGTQRVNLENYCAIPNQRMYSKTAGHLRQAV